MAIYFLSVGSDVAKTGMVEQKIRRVVPDLISIRNIQELFDGVAPGSKDQIYLLLLAHSYDHFATLAEIETPRRGRIFVILISDEISASDYKAVVRTGTADWVSVGADPQEIIDIIARHRTRIDAEHAVGAGGAKPVVVSFLPSAGGVGNATIALEVAIRLKTNKTNKERNICIIDLDFQGSHVCDYLDIEPRLQIQEISANPERLDAQLFEIFISRHASGLHVFAAPRSKFDFCTLNISALDAFFNLASTRYDQILIDLPTTWFSWTNQIICVSDGIIVTGTNTIPSLRQTVETLAAVRTAGPISGQIAVAINRCHRRLMGGILNRHHVESVLGQERVFYVGNDPRALESANTGAPLALTETGGAFSKELAAIAEFCTALKSSRLAASAVKSRERNVS
jgi:pilus assembly protein CpaE